MARILCVTAHPDDEAAAFGGTLRLYHDRGCEILVVCLTPGQAATYRGTSKTEHELAAIRRKEFAASCEILGIDRGIVLDYNDGQLYRADLHRLVGDVVLHIREFRPHIVLTFGPDGAVTGHPDHSMASVFATLAFEWAGQTNRYPEHLVDGLTIHRAQKLYYATFDFALPDRPLISPAPATTVIRIGDLVNTKIAAFAAHASQGPVFPVVRDTILARAREELFHLAATSTPSKVVAETDLLENVTESD
jgi:LmbE family N-acetylglucosaminyl deacetylase